MYCTYLFILILGVRTSKSESDASNFPVSPSNACIFGNGCYDQAGVRAFNPKEEEDELESRIIGGREAWPHSWPWQVSLQINDMPVCGAAILNERWVLTASHCFKRYKKPSLWTVMVGRHNLENANESCLQSTIVEKIITHKDYNPKTNENDIALLQLQTPLVFNKCVRPAGIWNEELPFLETCSVTGWGAIRENGPQAFKLQEVNVTIFEPQTCLKYFGAKMLKFMMCAGSEAGGTDACQGDSGGPLSCFNGERYKIAGVVSWGVGCGRARKPGVYTNVFHFKEWMDSTIIGELHSNDSDANLAAKCGQAKTDPCQLPDTLAEVVIGENGKCEVENLNEACPNSWPWHVSLQSHDTHYCSGVLVHPFWVLAPHHCLAKAGDVVVLGAHDLSIVSIQTVVVKSVVSLADDGSFPPVSDLAMIRLSSAARIGPTIFPICLTDKDDEIASEPSTCVTTGWGSRKATLDLSPDILHMARVLPLSENACKSGWGNIFNKDVVLCTNSAASTSCLGDSGAPMICQKDGIYYLVGLTTWGGKRCEPRKPAVFTRVSAFYSWIQDCLNT